MCLPSLLTYVQHVAKFIFDLT